MMNKKIVLGIALSCGLLAGPAIPTAFASAGAQQQQTTGNISMLTGTVVDENGDPAVGASIMVKGRKQEGTSTNSDGRFSLRIAPGTTISVSYVGYKTEEFKAANGMTIHLTPSAEVLNEVVVTALGVKKDKKSLGYAIDDIDSDELMRNKTANPINSLSGKIAGVNITQSSGAAGSGAQIILRGGTSGSESRDNQPLFVVDGIIYDNSSSVGGDSAFDGSTRQSTTSSNRLMDINPEDIENMSVLKGPAAAALYGSRAANGVIIITTKKGKSGNVEVNLAAKYTTSWVKDVPKMQNVYKRGVIRDTYDDNKQYTGSVYETNSYNSWGERFSSGDRIYGDQLEDFFQHGAIWDTSVSISGGNENGNFYLSGSYFDQDGVVPTTGYTKSTFRFNGEQKWKFFTFGANAAYSEARTDKTLTGAGLYGSNMNGALQRIYTFGVMDDMTHYLNEDGSRYRMRTDIEPWEESDNPYWIINRNKLNDKTVRFTGSFNVKADLTDWWWINFRAGVDNYTMDNNKRIGAGGVTKDLWQDGMLSENTSRYQYVTTNFMTNFAKTFGDFGFNLLLGTSTDNTTTKQTGLMGYRFKVPDFYSFDNVADADKTFRSHRTTKRLVGVYGEFRADWRNTVFLTVTGRNDWTSTLPKSNRSYFYPSVSGAIVFTQFLQDKGWMTADSPLSFGKIRASWAKVGKDTSPYETATTLWPVGTFLEGMTGIGNFWESGNPYLKPEMTKSTEVGVELRFFRNRLRLDYAYYTNDSYNQIMSPRGSFATGYILRSANIGNVLNKGMELSISGTPIDTRDWTWETGINMAGNRGRLEGLMDGQNVMYVTDVQYSNAQAASFNNGNFMAIAGYKYLRVPDTYIDANGVEQRTMMTVTNPDGTTSLKPAGGQLILDANGMPQRDKSEEKFNMGNREPKFYGGWNNVLRFKNFTFSMLWEFSVGGSVFNGTAMAMDQAGTSVFTANARRNGITIAGVSGTPDANGNYVFSSTDYKEDGVYNVGGVMTSGHNVIANYFQNTYILDHSHYITKVNSLRLRSISLSYELPTALLAKTKAIKRAVVTASATNLLLFTNYNGDPEVAASGAGAGGSSSVGFESCGVPSTATFSFGVNLTF